MATFDAYYPRTDMLLKTCPFNANHRVKDAKYAKHVRKCEQLYPNSRLRVRHHTSSSSQSTLLQWPSMSSVLPIDSEDGNCTDTSSLIESMNNMNVNDEWPSVSALSESNDVEMTIESTSNLNEGLNEDSQKDSAQPSDDSQRTSVAKHLIPQLLNSDYGSGDTDDWNGGQSFSIYSEDIDFDNLSDEQIQRLSEGFVDPIILSRMDKRQRKILYQKVNELKIGHKDRKVEALDELVALKDSCDPQLESIPPEIRKPRIHIKDLFKLKSFNKKLSKTEANGHFLSIGTQTTTSDNDTIDLEVGDHLEVDCNPMDNSATLKPCDHLDTKCNLCSQPISLTETNIKRFTVFCGNCSSSKFGGYFECHSCHLYGYFAKSQIVEHLGQHFPILLTDL